MSWESLKQLDKEINRLNNLIVTGKSKTPNLCKLRITTLTQLRIKFTCPLIYKFRVKLSNALHRLADWIW